MSIEGIKVDGANQPVHNNPNPEPKIDKTKILINAFQDLIKQEIALMDALIKSNQVSDEVKGYLYTHSQRIDKIGYEIEGALSDREEYSKIKDELPDLFV